MEKVIAVGDLAGDDLFFSLIICNGEGNLHRFIGRVLLGKVDEFYVEGCLLLSLSLHRHCFFLFPGWALSCSRYKTTKCKSSPQSHLFVNVLQPATIGI